MIGFLFAAPIIGLVWGALAKQMVRGGTYGAILGVGNFIMWNVYNAITNRLGLDTVKNLLVNLALFIVLGIIAGLLMRRFDRGSAVSNSSKSVD